MYQSRMALASGRFALVVNETNGESALAPWRPEVEQAVGKAVSGRAVQWNLGSERGLGIG